MIARTQRELRQAVADGMIVKFVQRGRVRLGKVVSYFSESDGPIHWERVSLLLANGNTVQMFATEANAYCTPATPLEALAFEAL